VAYLAALVWSVYVILTTSQETWKTSGMSQLLWLAVVLVMPLIGSMLFVAVGRQRLNKGANSMPKVAEASIR
jgi:hypothetical protein